MQTSEHASTAALDTPFSVGRNLRDVLSAAIMISNDRILINTSNLLLVSRFDRAEQERDAEVVRLEQEDACQVLGLYPAAKYRVKTEQAVAGLAAKCTEAGRGGVRQFELRR